MSATAFATRIIAAQRAHTLLGPGAEPDSRAQAYEAQRAICEGLGERVAGWKIADHPVLGMVGAPIFAGDIRADGGAWPLTPRLGVEIEIALWLKRDLPRGRHTRADVAAAVDSYCLGVELVGSRLAEPQRNLLAFLGDRMSNVGYVCGPARGAWRDEVVADRRCLFRIDGETIYDAPAAPPALDPLAVTMAWLERGEDLLGGFKAGQFVTTGSVCGVVPAPRKGTAMASIDGFGEVKFALT